jgi:ArsR family transcriptional regulator, arsenate/arsenite/antimonite-responsive transcriptional repressor
MVAVWEQNMPLAVYSIRGMLPTVDLISVYTCLCDRTRLRILNLLRGGPLCVCHVQAILGEPQVKVSKHLAYLRTHGLVAVERRANWRVYRLAEPAPPVLAANLACLQDCTAEEPAFRRDDARRARLRTARSPDLDPCCAAPANARKPRARSPERSLHSSP